MAVYRVEECDVLAAVTTPGFEFAREYAVQQGLSLGLHLVGDRSGDPPAVVLLHMPAGHVLERHAHDAARMEIVVAGSVILPDGRVLHAGDVSTSDPGEFYGPLTAGPAGSVTIEIFSHASGLPPKRVGDESAERMAAAAMLAGQARDALSQR